MPAPGSPDIRSVDDLIHRLGPVDGRVVVDLSRGAWLGNGAAAQIARQLGLAPEPGPPAATPPGTDWAQYDHGWRYAGIIADAVDREAEGDTVLVSAAHSGRRAASALRRAGVARCVVVLSREPISRHDRSVLDELARQGVRTDHLRYACDSTEPAPLEALLPGPTQIPTPVRLRGGLYLVPPELRAAAERAGPLDHDRLAARATTTAVAAYAQLHGNPYFADPALLCRQAWAELASAHEEGALDLLRHATGCARNPVERAICAAQLAGLGIALHRFDVAAASRLPGGVAVPELRGFLRQCRGWGLVMSGEPGAGLEELRHAAEELRHWRGRPEYGYLLNITALAELRTGHPDAALALEEGIARQLRDDPDPDVHLAYVNELNLARLRRRRGEAGAARAHYRAAFASTRGTGTRSDMLHAEVCAARLDASDGRTSEAGVGWLRAALIWATLDVPAAIGARVAAAVTGGSLNDPVEPALISATLLDRLGGPGTSGGTHDRVWLDAGEVGVPPPDAVMVAGPGWALTVLPGVGAAAHRDDRDDGRDALRRELARRLVPADLPAHGALVVDDRLRRGLARRPAEVVESALRLGVPTLRIDGREYRFDSTLVEEAEQRLSARVSPAVRTITATSVQFHRFRGPYPLSAEERAALDAVVRGGGPDACPVDVLRGLEDARVVELALSDTDCAELLRLAAATHSPAGGTVR